MTFCVGMLTWLHTEQKRFTEDEQHSGLNEKYFLEATQSFLKGIHFVVQCGAVKQKRKQKTLQRNDQTPFDRLKNYSNHCTGKLVNTLNNTHSKAKKRTKDDFRNTKKQHPNFHLHNFHSSFVKFRIVATFANAPVGFDVREL